MLTLLTPCNHRSLICHGFIDSLIFRTLYRLLNLPGLHRRRLLSRWYYCPDLFRSQTVLETQMLPQIGDRAIDSTALRAACRTGVYLAVMRQGPAVLIASSADFTSVWSRWKKQRLVSIFGQRSTNISIPHIAVVKNTASRSNVV